MLTNHLFVSFIVLPLLRLLIPDEILFDGGGYNDNKGSKSMSLILASLGDSAVPTVITLDSFSQAVKSYFMTFDG